MNDTSQTVRFTKMQGVGNDFVLIDGRDYPGLDGTALAPRLCDRRFGIGADGLLIVEKSQQAFATMQMFNPDGTLDMCGNGLRCVARYVAEKASNAQRPSSQGRGKREEGRENILTPNTLLLETLAGRRKASVVYPGGGECRITVEMGLPRFEPKDIPMGVETSPVMDYPLEVDGETMLITALSTGSTHTILFVPSLPDDDRFFSISPHIENHPLFPDRTSVMWTQVEEPHRLNLRIWERGAGETWGCGTGACAATVAAQRHGFTQGEVVVHSKGGELVIQWQEGNGILMTGPAEYVFEGSFRL